MINCRDSYGLICLDDVSNIVGMIVGSNDVYYNCKQFMIKDFFVIPILQGKGIESDWNSMVMMGKSLNE